MRCFIAIELPPAVKSALGSLLEELKKSPADIRWVNPNNIHLTLKFLGNVNEKNIPGVINIMDAACKQYQPLTLELKGLGIFPDINRPRILWIGAEGNSVLKGLQRDIEYGMAKIGFEREDRKFTAHLTLGRFRSLRGKEDILEKIKLRGNVSLGAINVSSISLMKSDLSPEGSRYARIAEVFLSF